MSHPIPTQDVTEPMLEEDDPVARKNSYAFNELNKTLRTFKNMHKDEPLKQFVKNSDGTHDLVAVESVETKQVPYETDIRSLVERETLNRKVLTEYISKHMKDGVDYGKIANFPKDVLFKPGSEKFCSLMRLRVEFHKDSETFEMAGSTAGLFCYKALLINQNGEIVGEGRGACSIQEKKNANTAIKIALKRAQIDAVLRTGGLSDFFTQDLEDMQETAKVDVLDVFNEPKPEPEEVPFSDNGDVSDPVCPKCGSAMKKRKRRSDGNEFWGCVQYPKCKGVRNV